MEQTLVRAPDRAQLLLERLRESMTAPGVPVSRSARATDAIEPEPALTAWLRQLVHRRLYTPQFEAELIRSMGPDLFGLRRLTPAPGFLAGVDLARLDADLVAPLLRRLSLTRTTGPGDLSVAELRAEAGPVSTVSRSEPERAWGQQDAPLLPESTVIPHVVHGIWLGGPIPAEFRKNYATAARRYAGAVDFVVWTDISRADAEAARRTPSSLNGRGESIRAMLDWAQDCGVHLVHVLEVFNAGQPMLLHPQFVAEMAKQIPRGYAGASDHLRLEILSLLGGAYVDGDNHLDAGSLPELFDAVAGSLPGFTLNVRPGQGVNSDAIVAPAGHPALALWRELTRLSYRQTQRELFGGLAQMAQPFVGRPRDETWLRYTVPRRSGILQGRLLSLLGFALDDPRLARPGEVVTGRNDLSWSRASVSVLPLTDEQVLERVKRIVTTLARRLISREGNLYLSAVAPAVAALPDPDSAWVAVLRLLGELGAAGVVPKATSITELSWGNDGVAETVALPAQAESLLDRRPIGADWLGAELAAGPLVWLLDEAVSPVMLTLSSAGDVDPVATAARLATAHNAQLRWRLSWARRVRLERATQIIDGLRASLTRTQAPPEVPAPEPETLDWVRKLMDFAVHTPTCEMQLAAQLGPDLFGLRALSSVPDFLVGLDLVGLPPEAVAPLLRRLSLTRPRPARLALEELTAEAGTVSSAIRSPEQRRWGQEGAPLLTEQAVIPHVLHGIWLGGPAPVGFRRNFGAGARRYAGAVDFVVWTDVSRQDVEAAQQGASSERMDRIRTMLEWAQDNDIHLVNVFEVFHAEQPMITHSQFMAELTKQLPRGYAGASDHLRVEIMARFGGAYVDGDNQFEAADRSLSVGLPDLFDAVVGSLHGFALHLLPNQVVANDVIVAPAGHPALILWREYNRATWSLTHATLFGGMDNMTQRHSTRAVDERWRRYTVPMRAGRSHGAVAYHLGIECGDPRLIKVSETIFPVSEKTWSRAKAGSPVLLADEEVQARVEAVVASLARRLKSREGDLYLVGAAPVIATLPDPDAAWIAVLRFLSILVEISAIPAITSVTRFRWDDDGGSEYVGLPPEAEEMLDYTHVQEKWFGSELSVPGQPVWLLDELVVPARLIAGPAEDIGPKMADQRRMTRPLTMPNGTVGIAIEGRLGVAWAGEHRVRPQDVVMRLIELGQTDRPVFLSMTGGAAHGVLWFVQRLRELLGQPVVLVDGLPGDDSSGEDWARTVIELATARAVACQRLDLDEVHRRANDSAGRRLSGPALLLSVLDTAWAASALADAEVVTHLAVPRQTEAGQEAFRQVLTARRELLERDIPTLGDIAATRAAEAASTLAGLAAMDEALRGPEHSIFTSRSADVLASDRAVEREIRAMRQRIERSSESAEAVAAQALAELDSGRWPALKRRMVRITRVAPAVRMAATVRDISAAVTEELASSSPAPEAHRQIDFDADRLRTTTQSAERTRVRRAARLTERLRAAQLSDRVAIGSPIPALPIPPPPMLAWLRRMIEPDLYKPEFEAAANRMLGPDPFGLRRLPPSPDFLADVDFAALPPEAVGPLLRRLSLTRAAPRAEDLTVDHLLTKPGPVTSVPRTTDQRRWGMGPLEKDHAVPGDEGELDREQNAPDQKAVTEVPTPLLSAVAAIPHLLHGIWLGGPVPEHGPFRRNFAVAARRYEAEVDVVVWTDVSRSEIEEARNTSAAEEDSRLKAVRSMLIWAEEYGITLVNVHEVFHAGNPMVLHSLFVTEMAKQLGRGYAGASDHLRLELINLFGGAYVDGDNQFDVDRAGAALTGSLPELFAAVAGSVHGFTLHILDEGDGVNNDVIVAPAGHPVLWLLREVARHSYRKSQAALYGGLSKMSLHFVGHRKDLLRYSLVLRTGRRHHEMMNLLGIETLDSRLIRSDDAIGYDSALTWAPQGAVQVSSMTLDQIVERAVRIVTILARQLINREGNLYLSEVAPVVEALPEPGAVWIAVLTLLTDLVDAGTVPPVSSVTEMGLGNSGTLERVDLPPEAERMLERTWQPNGWFGANLVTPGRPVWLLDELVTPARLRSTAQRASTTSLDELRSRANIFVDAYGATSGLQLGAGAVTQNVPSGYLGIWAEGRDGAVFAGDLRVRPDDLALLLDEVGGSGRRVLLVTDAGPDEPVASFADRLAALIHRPVLAVHGSV